MLTSTGLVALAAAATLTCTVAASAQTAANGPDVRFATGGRRVATAIPPAVPPGDMSN
jgi:hypothetical protein